jgi:hypothetical protein
MAQEINEKLIKNIMRCTHGVFLCVFAKKIKFLNNFGSLKKLKIFAIFKIQKFIFLPKILNKKKFILNAFILGLYVDFLF